MRQLIDEDWVSIWLLTGGIQILIVYFLGLGNMIYIHQYWLIFDVYKAAFIFMMMLASPIFAMIILFASIQSLIHSYKWNKEFIIYEGKWVVLDLVEATLYKRGQKNDRTRPIR